MAITGDLLANTRCHRLIQEETLAGILLEANFGFSHVMLKSPIMGNGTWPTLNPWTFVRRVVQLSLSFFKIKINL